jgi:flagellar motility protein MotE (MotC chaperone)
VNKVRLLPVVVMAIAALLVFKTLGLVTNGGYVLSGVTLARAAGGGGGGGEAEGGMTVEADHTVTPAGEPTMMDTDPVMEDPDPTLEEGSAAAGHGSTVAEEHGAAPAEGAAPEGEHGAPAAEGEAGAGDHAEAADAGHAAPSSSYCFEADVTLTDDGLPPAEEASSGGGGGHGASAEAEPSADEAAAAAEHAEGEAAAFAQTVSADCLPSGDSIPMQMNSDGTATPLANGDGSTLTEQQLLERLAARREELNKYEQDLTLRASIVDAAEKRIEERAATLQALETQIATLVDQRKEMETGQFAGIVAMYENMKPKDAATIFNTLDMEVLLRVAKAMSSRKMAPILAEMDPARAQELTVKMANLADQPTDQMTPEDLSALPQIVGQ